MEPGDPTQFLQWLLNTAGLSKEKLAQVDANAHNKLISAGAINLFGTPKMKEGASFYSNRYPQVLNSLAEPGLRNKVNGAVTALANEGTNMIGDAAIEHGLPLLMGLIAGGVTKNPQAAQGAVAAGKAVGPYVNTLVKDPLQSAYVDPHVYTGMEKLNPAQYLPSVHDLTGLITKNPTSRNVITGMAHHALDKIDENISGWAAGELQKHPTPQIVEPTRQKWLSDQPRSQARASDTRYVVKPIVDAFKGKIPWTNAFENAVLGAKNPALMRKREEDESNRKHREFGITALGNKP